MKRLIMVMVFLEIAVGSFSVAAQSDESSATRRLQAKENLERMAEAEPIDVPRLLDAVFEQVRVDELTDAHLWLLRTLSEEIPSALPLLSAKVENEMANGYGDEVQRMKLALFAVEVEIANGSASGTIDRTRVRRLITRIGSLEPERLRPAMVGYAELAYGRMLERHDREAAEAHYKQLLQYPETQIARKARQSLRLMKMQREPLEWEFTTMTGEPVSLKELRGKFVLIDVWATWCKPCKTEQLALRDVYKKYRTTGFEIIGVSVDKAADADKVRAYCDENGITWPQYFDGRAMSGGFGERYGITGVPELWLLNKEGLLIETNARGKRLVELLSGGLGSAAP